jgi:hypothetical protein
MLALRRNEADMLVMNWEAIGDDKVDAVLWPRGGRSDRADAVWRAREGRTIASLRSRAALDEAVEDQIEIEQQLNCEWRSRCR